MKPQVINGKIYLPMECVVSSLRNGDLFKLNERGSLFRITGVNKQGWFTAAQVFGGKQTISVTPNFPVLQFI